MSSTKVQFHSDDGNALAGGVARPGNQLGIASLAYDNKVFRFRTNPNAMWWSYNLITNVEPTYGGRVVQILGANISDLSVTVDCGNGGWDYLMEIVNTMRDILQWQRAGTPAVFEYTGRGYKLGVYVVSVPFQDDWRQTVREVTINFRVQEDISAVASGQALDVEMQRLADGIYGGQGEAQAHNSFNDAGATKGAAGLFSFSSPPGGGAGASAAPGTPASGAGTGPLPGPVAGG